VKRILLLLAVLIVAVLAAAFIWVKRQGLSSAEYAAYGGAAIHVDERGIPTIEAETWHELIEAQGFVVASERLFQMDLMRRSAYGGLAEWFGEAALGVDKRRALEDWEGVADRGYRALPDDERENVDAYARGVNRFIEQYENRWGIEYTLLRVKPGQWKPRDSLLVLLAMDEQLTASSAAEAAVDHWAAKLGPEWSLFLFPDDHPWNEPMFGERPRPGPPIPFARALAAKKIDATEADAAESVTIASRELGPSDASPGSNNWAWCGKTGCFLANDPHLGASVPHIWYANRLRVSATDWVVGVSVPGIPGVALGMNPHLAWAFTNVGEDVDDLLIEQVSADETLYLADRNDGVEVWKPIARVEKTIPIRGGRMEKVTALFTHRGPLAKRGERWCSRQWLPFKEGMLRFPMLINRATSWEEMNAALDRMPAPAQNVLVVDRRGDIGYRASGTGVVRRVSGRRPQPAIEGEWAGFEPAEKRPRKLLPARIATAGASRYLATANERIWVDRFGHRWSEDLRKDRIRRVLRSRDDFSHGDMHQLQLDTESRYGLLLVRWIAAHASTRGAVVEAMLERWAKWDGSANDAESFTDAAAVDRALTKLCVDRVKSALLGPEAQGVEYQHALRTAWIITMLGAENGVSVFGFDAQDLADHLLAVAIARAAHHAPPYYDLNRWSAQHPFVARVPLVGRLFAVDTPAQKGWRGVVRIEQPTFGSSVRMVWDLGRPVESTWCLPVGQSGHIGSAHYHDLQGEWFGEHPYKVLDPGTDWGF
jgi:penicillin amidase